MLKIELLSEGNVGVQTAIVFSLIKAMKQKRISEKAALLQLV